MNPTRLLGAIALVVGSASLFGECFISDELLKQTTGFVWEPLRPSYMLTTLLGLFALWLETPRS